MLDREGFRPNVGIILLNANNEVWWGKRVREHSWQFPQGGIKYGETPEQADHVRYQAEQLAQSGGVSAPPGREVQRDDQHRPCEQQAAQDDQDEAQEHG